MTGCLPFNDETPEKVFIKILKKEMKMPTVGTEEGEISQDAYDFINALLTLDPK